MTLGTVASVVGIAGGLNSIFGGGSSSGGGGGTTANGGQGYSPQEIADAADPFHTRREMFGGMFGSSFPTLTNFDPSQIQNDPAYKFQMEQGIGAINKGAAASGMLGSGNRLMDLEKYGQGLASSFTDKQFSRNMSILQMMGQAAGAFNNNGGAIAGAYNAANSNGMQQGQLNYQNNQQNLGNIMNGLGGLSRNIGTWGSGGGNSGGGNGGDQPPGGGWEG